MRELGVTHKKEHLLAGEENSPQLVPGLDINYVQDTIDRGEDRGGAEQRPGKKGRRKGGEGRRRERKEGRELC